MVKQNVPDIIAELQSEAGVEYHAEIPGDRHMLTVDLDRLERHPQFSVALRAIDPPDRKLLEASQKNTKGPIYLPCVYIERVDESLRLFLVDGHQRVASARANGDERITVQYVSRWTDQSIAMRDAIDLQYGRFEMTEADVAALIKHGKLMQVEIARHTGYDESKVNRLTKVVEHDWMWQLYREKCIGLSPAGKLIDACGGNYLKLKSLRESLEQRYRKAEAIAKKHAAEIAANPNVKHSKQKRQQAKIESHFREFDWGSIAETLQDSDGGCPDIDLTSSPKKLAVEVGETAEEWKQELAVRQFFGRKPSELEPNDINHVLERWDFIRDNLTRLRDKQEPVSFEERSRPLTEAAAPQPQSLDVEFVGDGVDRGGDVGTFGQEGE